MSAATVCNDCGPGGRRPAMVGRKACGCCVACIVVPQAGDSPEQFQGYGRELKKWARSGLTAESRTVCWVRHTKKVDGGIGRCEHQSPKKGRAA